MNIKFSEISLEEYISWQFEDKKTLKKINTLIKDIVRNGSQGLGKSEKLKYIDAYSRRIDKKNRLVFKIVDEELLIISCKGHYED